MSLDNYAENARIPEVAQSMGRGQPNDLSLEKLKEFIIQMLRSPGQSMMQGVQPQWPPGMMQPNAPQPPQQPQQPQQPPNSMPNGGGFNPGNRPGMNMPGM